MLADTHAGGFSVREGNAAPRGLRRQGWRLGTAAPAIVVLTIGAALGGLRVLPQRRDQQNRDAGQAQEVNSSDPQQQLSLA
jgi:hypothetical protein